MLTYEATRFYCTAVTSLPSLCSECEKSHTKSHFMPFLFCQNTILTVNLGPGSKSVFSVGGFKDVI